MVERVLHVREAVLVTMVLEDQTSAVRWRDKSVVNYLIKVCWKAKTVYKKCAPNVWCVRKCV
jgi:hypothetical protein